MWVSKVSDRRGDLRQLCFLQSQLCVRVSEYADGLSQPHSPPWSVTLTPHSCLSAECWFCSPLKTNYIRETLGEIFCEAHFSHYPCQWTSNCPVIWDSLFYSLSFGNNLNSLKIKKEYRTGKLKWLLLKQKSKQSHWLEIGTCASLS
jgi:hypothetical protein